MSNRYWLLSPLIVLALAAGCVSIPKYDSKFDDSLSSLQNDVINHFDDVALDRIGGACTPDATKGFWQKADRKVDLLVLRAGYIPKYGDVAADLTRLRTSLDTYEKLEDDYRASETSKGAQGHQLCLPTALAEADSQMLAAEIGSIIKLELQFKAGASK